MAGAGFERQETGLVNIINRAYNDNGQEPFTLIGDNGTKITKVKGAQKFTGRAKSGAEPYTDVQILRDVAKQTSRWIGGKPVFSDVVNLSNKGIEAPSVAGGGLSGLEGIIPGIGRDLFAACVTWYKDKRYKTGDAGTDLYVEVDTKYKEAILVGNEDMGGPIDYMYVGPMDVRGISSHSSKQGFSGWNPEKQELTVNGNLTKAVDYANKYDIFYRIRKRRVYQVLDLNKKTGGSAASKGKDTKEEHIHGGEHVIFVTPKDIGINKRTKSPQTSFSGAMYNPKYIGHFGPPRSQTVSKGKGVDPGQWAWMESKGKHDNARRVVIVKARPTGVGGSGSPINGFVIYGPDDSGD